jgi:U3 small nucleolar RNA-associated protein MPP10
MTAFPPPPAKSLISLPEKASQRDGQPGLLGALAPENRHSLLEPTPSIVNASLQLAKHTLDAFAGKLADEQIERQKESRRKRKRGDKNVEDEQVLKIRKVHTEGFGVDQVWEQAKRIIDSLTGDAERALRELGGGGEASGGEANDDGEGGVELLEFGEDGFEVGSDDDSADPEEDALSEVEDKEEFEAEEGVIADADAEELSDVLEGEDDYDEEDDEEAAGVFVEDPNGLNDGFFSIDEFNKQSEFLEQQDAAGDPYTGEASDEEDIDWDADPRTMTAKSTSSSRPTGKADLEDDDEDMDEDDDEEEEGPTFGNMDLNAAEGDSEADEGAYTDEEVDPVGDNTNDILYKDFFEPPPRKAGKGERQADYLSRQARKAKETDPQDDEAGIERAMADVRRDLFEDASDREDSEDALSDVDPSDPKSRRSAHERRQAKIAEEIRRLEAASVAKRDWTLSGQARAADRPLNSLVEENLDFEHTGKPVPEITAEISESIEELIKRRILAQEFDEVMRRRPDASSTSADTRRGVFELDDSKPQQSLAELYEEEHVKAHNADTYVSKADEKMQKEENEIAALWKDVSAKLDALSSWHYKPKPAAPSLTVVSDVATVAMEDAQPTTASGISGGESMLAPQEIYKAGKEKDSVEKGEVIPKSGAPVARQEMTREEKLRRRRREKEKIKKRGRVELNQRPESKKTQQKRETVGALKKGGVKVIDKRGNVTDVDGNKVHAATTLNGAGAFKL